MALSGRRGSIVLFLGDLLFFVLALWLTLLVRYFTWPSQDLFLSHLVPFSYLFFLWVLVFFIYDLYRRQTLIFANRLPARVLEAQLINSLIAVLAFYFIPYFNRVGLTPKTNLFIYLVVSSLLILGWRRFLARFVYRPRRLSLRFDCAGEEIEALKQELAASGHHSLASSDQAAQLVVINRYEPTSPDRLTELYRLLFRGVSFASVQDLYEEIFGRVPLTLVNERWFLERVSSRSSLFYDFFKRLMDLIIALGLGLLSLLLYPFVIAAIKLEDGGPAFYYDARVGRHGRDIRIAKFRTMSLEPEIADRRVTRVGSFLRRLRLDELPQLWSVVRGDQSLIGPRPEKREYVELYRERIPFYDARHLIAPGLSGWAQIYHDRHPHFALAEDATREKLSYDLYYVKNRSLWLDIAITLKTIKTLLSRQGI